MSTSVGPRARDAILYGGLTAGLLDACDAVVFFGTRGASPERIARHVAAGLLGRASFDAGAWAIALGVVLHFCVALSIATVFYLVSRQVPALLRRPVIVGLGFGVAAYFAMEWIVVPLSRAPHGAGFPPWPVMINGIVGHAVLIGLPIALFAARSTRSAQPARPAPAQVTA